MSWNGFDELGFDRGIAEYVTQPLDRRIQAMFEVAKAGSGPQFLLQFFAGDELPWSLQQGQQDLDGLAAKLQARTILAQFAGIRRDLEGAESDGNWNSTRFRHTLPEYA